VTPGREISIGGGRLPQPTSAALAAQLLGRDTRASEAAIRAERKLRLEEALNSMDSIDREVLALRHFEQLSNTECAGVLSLSESAATKRYIRALRRLKEILTGMPDGASESWTWTRARLKTTLYRAGKFAEALQTLEKSLAAGEGQVAAFDLFVLAMVHHRLGHRQEAPACYDRAVSWQRNHPNLPAPYATELAAFRAEAEEFLAVPRAQLPADVFAPE
jgi:tetratricopeptide (TPR) repeat protein